MDSSRERRVEDCDNCGWPIDDCACRCPYCGETEACECGMGTANAGGD